MTHDQIETYDAKGYVRLPAAFDRAAAESMAELVWARMGELHGIRRDDPNTWDAPGPWRGLNRFKKASVFQAVGSHVVCTAIDDLLGPGCWTKPSTWGGFLIKFPDRTSRDPTFSDTYWHVDFHFTHRPGSSFGVRLFSFLSDVVPGGGATLVVSGSHRLVERFVASLTPRQRSEKFGVLRDQLMRSHPWLAALTKASADRPRRAPELLQTPGHVDGVSVRVEELCGEPGDVVIMHPWLLHSPSPNASDHPRLQLAKDIFAELASHRVELTAAAAPD